ncbi:PfkB domain protein [Alkaliphilus metalliredigens QYMF]|uniref:PfkB domain protein n=1 Tax=Alkaliphilus metalliredigens (strain QYMF) TaxID=293826 RepID=A6TMY1_ALKMQ|nr:PfkB family carbohydrate kinase [Alkaliphilus metalliredigens]ABR47549.1 PfkB domain protein [Alkaliphilus metalliredigens QYMF]
MKIAAVGENIIDDYHQREEAYIGGGCINFLMTLAEESKHQLSYIGPIALDYYGESITQALTEKEINVEYATYLEGKSPLVKIEMHKGEKSYGQSRRGVLEAFRLTDQQITLIQEQDHIHATIIGGLLPLINKMKSRGTVSFDYSRLQNERLILNTASFIDFPCLSRDEFTQKERTLMEEIHKEGSKEVILLLGDKGSVVYDGEKFTKIKSEKLSVIDTLGAGDAYISQYISCRLTGVGIKSAMETATAKAIGVCQHFGGFPQKPMNSTF